jgi:hypothetical protein
LAQHAILEGKLAAIRTAVVQEPKMGGAIKKPHLLVTLLGEG